LLENWPTCPDRHSSPPLHLVVRRWPYDGGLPTRFRTEPDVLFNGQSPDRFNPINGNSKNPTEEAADYAQQLPDTIDLILLSVGEDGHTASLFPHSQQLDSQQKVEVVTHSPKYPKNRITITPKVI